MLSSINSHRPSKERHPRQQPLLLEPLRQEAHLRQHLGRMEPDQQLVQRVGQYRIDNKSCDTSNSDYYC